ncbi:MAG: hypothetical protein WC791_03685 [Candidatus Paceibacterota bacterium]|jgi:hypothetical protein
MLKILIVANGVSSSHILMNGNIKCTINELPQKLWTRVLNEVAQLSDRGVSAVEFKEGGHFVLTRNSQNYVVVPCPEFLKGIPMKPIIETIQLLRWYLGTHLYACEPGCLGGRIGCNDCHRTQPGGVPFSDNCVYEHCSSHTKWAQIIEGYEPPVNPNAGKLDEKIQECIEKHKKQQSAKPTGLEEKANEWAKKC